MQVGVIIAAHNREKEVQSAIRSVFCQTRLPERIVYVDDASTDNSINAVLETYTEHPEGIRCISTRINKCKNPALAKQVGAELIANMDILFCLDSDDFIDSKYVETALKVFAENPKVAIAYPDMIYFITNGLTDEKGMPRLWKQQTFCVREFDLDAFRQHNWVCGCSPIRARAFWQVGGWEDTQFYDRHLWTKIVTSGWTAQHMPGIFYYYRQHENQLSRTRSAELRTQGLRDIEAVWNNIKENRGTRP